MRIAVFTLCFLLSPIMVAQAMTPNSHKGKCISYWNSGALDCEEKEEKQELPPQVIIQQPVTPTVVVPKPEPKKELSEKEKLEIQVEQEVDEFLDNHGKPPREFARFMINPTLENALIWAQKYDDMLKRTKETTEAWMKAQYILKEKEAGNLNVEIPELPNQRRAVPDYGVEWSSEDKKFHQASEQFVEQSVLGGITAAPSDDGRISGFREQPQPQPTQQAFSANTISNPEQNMAEMFAVLEQLQKQEDAKNNVGKMLVSGAKPKPVASGNVKELLPNSAMVEDGKIHVNYYFSADCPYCKKFEPGLQNIIEDLGDKIQVTCVDMTPGKKVDINIYGKVDCDWRPLMPDEMSTFSIKSTPTILVNFPGKRAVERLEGSVSEENLRTYLKLE